jgi:hypothetical protein
MNIHRTPKEEEVKYNLLGQEISKIKDEKNIGIIYVSIISPLILLYTSVGF